MPFKTNLYEEILPNINGDFNSTDNILGIPNGDNNKISFEYYNSSNYIEYTNLNYIIDSETLSFSINKIYKTFSNSYNPPFS
jgi:hypothetical protein